ncbi:hypothetical protein DFJ73DRAFT_780121 [Zopfochytrium polystomum]|nr:hypothetical protein DFJ73DRAFT_780121 [Zopfochytrium polystomum]
MTTATDENSHDDGEEHEHHRHRHHHHHHRHRHRHHRSHRHGHRHQQPEEEEEEVDDGYSGDKKEKKSGDDGNKDDEAPYRKALAAYVERGVEKESGAPRTPRAAPWTAGLAAIASTVVGLWVSVLV